MPNPTVCAVMLANGREEMVARAIASFKSQTYQEKRLLILDTTPVPLSIMQIPGMGVERWPAAGDRKIGTLRNLANSLAKSGIICHWDSDDWSHPNRIAEQVALLQSSGADCVGYREMLFWDRNWRIHCAECGTRGRSGQIWCECGSEQFAATGGESWLYSHPMPTYALGTSLCYWRHVWEASPFIDGNQEDWHFIHKVRTVGVSSLPMEGPAFTDPTWGRNAYYECANPRMVASIHGGNTCSKIEAACDEWRRMPDYDEHCRRIMEGS